MWNTGNITDRSEGVAAGTGKRRNAEGWGFFMG
jgi:hypothetical protein